MRSNSNVSLLGVTMNRLTQVVGFVTAVGLLGCGTPELIDRTQPYFTKKSDLLTGTWYIKETVVDVPPTSPVATIGYGGDLEKVRFEVKEDMLIGYRAYEQIPGLDPRVDRVKSRPGKVVFLDGRPFKGSPVFGWRVTSHFDRQRQYNAATGEQANVLEENTSDRPWYEREYMRIAWAQNMVQNVASDCTGDKLSPWGCFRGASQFRFVTPNDQNPEDDGIVTACKDTQGADVDCSKKGAELVYMDYTVRAIVNPPTVYYEGYGDIPYCLFNSSFDCESSEVKVRVSLKKVNESEVQDYEPLHYNERVMAKFGFFRNELTPYDKQAGYTETGRKMYAMRHNIWKNAKRPVEQNGEVILETIPVTEREPKPIVYYMTSNFPDDLLPVATMAHAEAAGRKKEDTLEYSWDKAFRKAVAIPRGLAFNDPSVPQMFYVCQSPVPQGAPAACGKPGTYVRLGDLRYNLVPYVEQITGGLLGLGPSSMDPETGQVIQAVANVYGPGLDRWSASSQQVMDLLNGELKIEDFIKGKDIVDYVKQNLNATDPRRPASGPRTSAQPLVQSDGQPLGSFHRLSASMTSKMDVFLSEGHLPTAKVSRKELVAKLLKNNPTVESELLNLPEMREMVLGAFPSKAIRARLESDPVFFRNAARDFILGKDPMTEIAAKLRKEADPRLGCLYEFSYVDDDFIYTAKQKKKLYDANFAKYQASGAKTCVNSSACTAAEAKSLARADVWSELRREAWRSIAEHEVGHTVGLRHNFSGSFDSINYQDGYWDLRKQTIGILANGQRVIPTTPANLAEAAKQNQAQIDQGMNELQYSSIMDYGQRVNSQNHGLGKYDDAAILFGYSGGPELGWVEVFNDYRGSDKTKADKVAAAYDAPSIDVPTDVVGKQLLVRGVQVEVPVTIAEHYSPTQSMYTDHYHYTTIPFHFAEGGQSFEAQLDQGISRMKSRSFRKWSDMEFHYRKLDAAIKAYALDRGDFDGDYLTRARELMKSADPKHETPVEVPYMFCTDNYLGANLACNVYDQGADIFDMTTKWLERWEQTYIWSNFRRDQVFFTPNSTLSAKFRWASNLPNVYQQWYFNTYYIYKYYKEAGIPLTVEQLDQYFDLGDPVWQNYWTMAVMDSTNTMLRTFSTPAAGYHARLSTGAWKYVDQPVAGGNRLPAARETAYITDMKTKFGYADVLYVARGPGRSMYTQYDTKGYDFFTRVDEVGHFWDQYVALNTLVASDTKFLGVDRGADQLAYIMPYYLVFNKELAGLWNNVWTEQRSAYAGQLAKLNDQAVWIPPVLVDGNNFISNFSYPLPTPVPVDGQGNAMPLQKIEPTPTWSTKYYSQLWGMAYFTELFNQEFANFNQVFKLGSGESLSPAPSHVVVSFPDNTVATDETVKSISGGYVYSSLLKTSDPSPVWVAKDTTASYSIKAANVTAANLKAANLAVNKTFQGQTAGAWEGQLREQVRQLEIMRGMYAIFGQAF